jgi:hypothetical protein
MQRKCVMPGTCLHVRRIHFEHTQQAASAALQQPVKLTCL